MFDNRLSTVDKRRVALFIRSYPDRIKRRNETQIKLIQQYRNETQQEIYWDYTLVQVMSVVLEEQIWVYNTS